MKNIIADPAAIPTRPPPIEPYAPPRPDAPIDLFLDANEGPFPIVDPELLVRAVSPERLRHYPSARSLEQLIARRLCVNPARIVVTAGGDDAIDRACRAVLSPGSELIFPSPSFEMIARYARAAGAEVTTVPWATGAYPLRSVLQRISASTSMIAVVSPNNPTGAVASAQDLLALSRAAPGAVFLVDLAYTEFADEDLTGVALSLPNAVIIRTFSKAYGLAGLRVGYAVAPEAIASTLRSAGGPYPVSAPSLFLAEQALIGAGPAMRMAVATIRSERTRLRRLLLDCGVRTLDSQANFVLAEFEDAGRVWRALAAGGIAVRRFEKSAELTNALRITCPGDDRAFARLEQALRAILGPAAESGAVQ